VRSWGVEFQAGRPEDAAPGLGAAAGQGAGPGEDEETVEQGVDAVEFGVEAVGEDGWHRVGPGQRDVEGGAHGGERGAQFVRGVGDEAALGGERLLEAFK
jgi:hypothetical protein